MSVTPGLTDATAELVAALANLTATERRALVVATRNAEEHHRQSWPRWAQVHWATLLLVQAVSDREDEVLQAASEDWQVAELPAERWTDEGQL